MASGKNLIARVAYGDLRVEVIAEGASWNPDIADEAMMETSAWEAADADDD